MVNARLNLKSDIGTSNNQMAFFCEQKVLRKMPCNLMPMTYCKRLLKLSVSVRPGTL